MRAPDPEAVKAAADRAEARSGRGGIERPGRGRLSSIDQLPDEAQEDIVWAVGELNKRQQTQDEIRVALNERLARKGLDEISRSAFNRRAMKVAAMSSRLNEARHIFEGVAPQFTAERVDENTVALGEFIKLVIFELTQREGHELGPKGAMELARAHLAVIQGQKISADRRRHLEADFKAKAEKAFDGVAKAKGIPAEVQAEVRSMLFGTPPPKPAETPHAP